jgi:hypothetical protein
MKKTKTHSTKTHPSGWNYHRWDGKFYHPFRTLLFEIGGAIEAGYYNLPDTEKTRLAAAHFEWREQEFDCLRKTGFAYYRQGDSAKREVSWVNRPPVGYLSTAELWQDVIAQADCRVDVDFREALGL